MRSTSGSPLSQGCGRGPLQLVPLGVSTVCLVLLPKPAHIYPQSESFAATGWRVGWLVGPKSIIGPTLAACTRIVFCSNSPLQEAAAAGIEQAAERDFFPIQRQQYTERREVLMNVFDELGMKYTLPQGAYFILLVRRLARTRFFRR